MQPTWQKAEGMDPIAIRGILDHYRKIREQSEKDAKEAARQEAKAFNRESARAYKKQAKKQKKQEESEKALELVEQETMYSQDKYWCCQ